MSKEKPHWIMLAVIVFAVIVVGGLMYYTLESMEPQPLEENTRTVCGVITRLEKDWYRSGVGGYVEHTNIWINGETIQLSGDIDLAVGEYYEIRYNTRTLELLTAKLLEAPLKK
jgi:hypothetical protein